MSDEEKIANAEELSDGEMDDISGGKWVFKWYTVYQVIKESNPPMIVEEFDTREKAEEYARNLSFHHVEEVQVRR